MWSKSSSTELGADGRSPTLTAEGIPDHQGVELRVVFPTEWLTSTSGATVHPGDGLEGILADEEAAALRTETSRQGLRNSLMIVVGMAGLLPLYLAFVFLRHGKEPRVRYDREYEQGPPSALEPAMVGALVRQGKADESGFVATIFDLIRRGVLTAEPVTIERRTWGGLRSEQISDLQIGLGEDPGRMRDFERTTLTVLNRVLEDGPRPLTEFRKAIREDAAANAKSYDVFGDRVKGAFKAAKDRLKKNGYNEIT